MLPQKVPTMCPTQHSLCLSQPGCAVAEGREGREARTAPGPGSGGGSRMRRSIRDGRAEQTPGVLAHGAGQLPPAVLADEIELGDTLRTGWAG